MTRIELIPNFLVSYFYHAACDAANAALEQKVPESLQNAVIALVMSQCALEAYINHLIRENKLSKKKFIVTRRNKQEEKDLSELSIREKWEQVPILLSGQKWKTNDAPFSRLSELVKERNDLIHFDTTKYVHMYNSPREIIHTDGLSEIFKDGKWLLGSKVVKLAAIGVSGPKIIQDMITGLHAMLGTTPPDFLSSEKMIYKIKIHRK